MLRTCKMIGHSIAGLNFSIAIWKIFAKYFLTYHLF